MVDFENIFSFVGKLI